jgi:hypothetical protein
MSKTKKVVLTVFLSIIASLWIADEYLSLRFRGDAFFSGGPVFGYEIRMRPVPFYRPAEYVFHFRGLPDQEMSLQLYAEGKSEENREELTHLDTELDALLVDQNGRIVCHASGVPRDGQNEHIWVLTSGPSVAAFWHWNCTHMPLKPSVSYTLTLRISDVDPKTPKIDLLPVLEGGQFDSGRSDEQHTIDFSPPINDPVFAGRLAANARVPSRTQKSKMPA